MRRLGLWFLPAALLAGEVRYARVGEVEGRPEVQIAAADAWTSAIRNTVLLDGAWVRTGAGSRAEIELDEGSAFRLDAEALCELSDYTRLSTGQRVTLLSLDRGVAYFTGAAAGRDTTVLAVPGAQITVRGGTRLRLEAGEGASQIAVLEGAVLFSSPSAELQIKEGQLVRVEPANTSRFFLFNEIPALDSDKWSQARDKALVTPSAAHVASPPFGLADLDANGTWIDTSARGTVWKPKSTAGWAPFRNGKWAWYDGLGYTWISAEPWGWLPYHYGRWAMDENAGWVWVPGKDQVFSPGDVYWLRGARLAGWGPLAAGEQWDGRSRPQLFLLANTTFAAFTQEMREIDPAGFAAPKDPLTAAAFTAALPSPAMAAARLEARRPVLRAGSTRVIPFLAGVSYGTGAGDPGAGGSMMGGMAEAQGAGMVVNTTVIAPPPPPPVFIAAPPPEPPVEYYPAPYAGGTIVVVNPPERGGGGGHGRERPGRREEPANPPARRELQSGEQRHLPSEAAKPSAPAQVERPRSDADQRRHEPAPPAPQQPISKPSAEQPKAAAPPPPAPAPEKHVERRAEPVHAAEKPAARSESAPRSEGESSRSPNPR